ncbi:hypothetical protein BX070DRAFT_30313 [Coemansia spiralis]|nr:hypothetical protein BX070DRAFT_30313 [Coemansia spiralis]
MASHLPTCSVILGPINTIPSTARPVRFALPIQTDPVLPCAASQAVVASLDRAAALVTLLNAFQLARAATITSATSGPASTLMLSAQPASSATTMLATPASTASKPGC